MDQNQNVNSSASEQPTPDRVPQGNDDAPRNEFDYGTASSYGYTSAPPPKSEPNGYAIASLVLGVLSVILCCCSCISIITAILAIVFALLSRQGTGMRGTAIGGLICGIFGLVLSLIMIVTMLLGFIGGSTTDTDFEEFYSEFYGEEFPDEFFGSDEDGYYVVE